MDSKNTTWFICQNSNTKGLIDFYMLVDGQSYYLFSQKFRHGIWNFFKNGVRFETVLNYSKAKHDTSIINVMQRLRRHVTYLQKTENMMIPEVRNQFVA